jgi:hypothetical protein
LSKTNLYAQELDIIDGLFKTMEEPKKQLPLPKPIKKNVKEKASAQEKEIKNKPLNKTTIKKQTNNIQRAPFGLTWDNSKEMVKKQGVEFIKIKNAKDLQTYKAFNLPKPLKGVGEVHLSFADDDRLWKISAISEIIKDDPSGKEIKKLYKKLTRLLGKKYKKSNKRETCSKKDASGTNFCLKQNFMKGLMTGKVIRFAFFQNEFVQIQFTIGAVSPTNSFYSLIYKNKSIIEDRENKEIDAL